MDRIDIRIEVPTVTAADLIAPGGGETSAAVAARVAAARAIQAERYIATGGAGGITCNAQAGAATIETVAAPDRAGQALLHEAAGSLALSARGYHRVLKVARTLADLDGAETVSRLHIAEALSYRAAGGMLAAAA